ncbi:putative parB-like partition protein [Burkholderia pseudomallei MSHR4378]|nr:putative parB-like partition protein [Burkholderia pseudomallei MSHR4378]
MANRQSLSAWPSDRTAAQGDQAEPIQPSALLPEVVHRGAGGQSGETGPTASNPRHSRLRQPGLVLRQRRRPPCPRTEGSEQGIGQGNRRRSADRHSELQARLRPQRPTRFANGLRQRDRLEALSRGKVFSEPKGIGRASRARRIDGCRCAVDRQIARSRDAGNGCAPGSLRLEHGISGGPLSRGARHRLDAAPHQQDPVRRPQHPSGRRYREGKGDHTGKPEAREPAAVCAAARDQAERRIGRRSEVVWRGSAGATAARPDARKAGRDPAAARADAVVELNERIEKKRGPAGPVSSCACEKRKYPVNRALLKPRETG